MAETAITTLVIEPDHHGHHLQSASWVVRAASRWGPVVLLTNREARGSAEFATFLADAEAEGRVEVREVFDSILPPTAQVAEQMGRVCRDADPAQPVGVVIHMDGDQALKRWWYLAPRHLRGLAVRPRVTFMLTRYPARARLLDRPSQRLRVSKSVLAVVARLTRALDRVTGFAGRDDTARGWIVRRAVDPAFSTAHSRDAAALRRKHGLPLDRRLVGVFGVLTARRNAPMILEGMERAGLDAELLIAGKVHDDMRGWLDGLSPQQAARLRVRDAFLDDDELDELVAAVDVVPLALTNNGPSGIMGKAEAAGVPVVTAGSVVRAAEVTALRAGVACALDPDALGRAMADVLAGRVRVETGREDPWEAVDRYVAVLLEIGPDGRPPVLRRLAGGR
ncbi:MAG: hypothetical protein PGN07_09775 [Aeromicrobium erythreum]